MTPSSIASIRQQVAQTHAVLLQPSLDTGVDLTAAILGLELAVSQMRDLEGAVPVNPVEKALLKVDLEALRLDLRRVEQLARSGENFWRGWGRMLGQEPDPAGYTAAGERAALKEQPTASIAVTG